VDRDSVPQEVTDLIDRHIPSVGVLEALLLLLSTPARSWSADEVSEELRTSVYSETKNLEYLRTQGFVGIDDSGTERRFRYEPADKELDHALRALAEMYEVRRVTVIDMIYPGAAKPRAALRDFANAFRFVERKKDG
jgi:hypothetical protein